MNATAITYNPLRAAAEAALSEITSEQAQQFYSLKAQKDFQTALDGAITVCAWAYQLAQMTYMMGIQARVWCEELEANAQEPTPVTMSWPIRSSLLLAPAKDTPMVAPVEAARKLLSKAIRSGLSLIQSNSEEIPQMDEVITPGTLLLLPALQTGILGEVWNPEPTDMHIEVQRMATASAKAEDELVSALEVPGAKGKTRKPRDKAEPKTSARNRREAKVGDK